VRGLRHAGARLHARIYFAVLASVAMTALLAGLAWRLHHGGETLAGSLDLSAEVAAALLGPADAPSASQAKALARWGERTRTSLALFSAARAPIAAWGERLPAPPSSRTASGSLHAGPSAPSVFLRLPDGRWLVARRQTPGAVPVGFLGLLLLAAASVAVAAWPISRRITRRLERLKEGVEALGSGDLGTRVPVEGRDEVAALAGSFNGAAERIERLVAAERRLLANASHELRSPLARLRVASGLLEGDERLKEEIARDVAELDALVEEVLVASRLDAGAREEPDEPVDLMALAAEECARADAPLAGEVVVVPGSPRLLRRLLRNLLENARRHGGGSVEVAVRRGAGGVAELDVLDRGPGVPAELGERIFEPFFRLPGAADGGAGLGLSIARQVARRHGGDLVFLPREGGGTLFRATLRAT
jgi:signal transduction histidine kinase